MQKPTFLAIVFSTAVAAKERWPMTQSQHASLVAQPSASWPILFGCVNPAPHSHTVHAIDAESGKSNWNITVRSMSNSPCRFTSGTNTQSTVCLQSWDENDNPNQTVEAHSVVDGTLQWRLKAPDSCGVGSLAGFDSDKAVYMLCSNNSADLTLSQVLKVGTADGKVEWVFNHSGQELGPVYQIGKAIYIAGDSGNFTPVSALGGVLHSVNPDDGSLLWTYTAGAPLVGLTSAKNGTVLLLTSMDGNLHAIRTLDGKQLWRVRASVPKDPTKWFPHSLFPIVGAPVIDRNGDSIYLFGTDGLHVFSSSTGEAKWSDKDAWGGGDQCSLSSPLLGELDGHEVVYSVANDTHKPRPYPAGADPDVLATRTTDAHIQWRSHPGFEGPCPWMWYVSHDAKSMFATVELGNFFLHALNTNDGTHKWQFQCPSLGSPVMLV